MAAGGGVDGEQVAIRQRLAEIAAETGAATDALLAELPLDDPDRDAIQQVRDGMARLLRAVGEQVSTGG